MEIYMNKDIKKQELEIIENMNEIIISEPCKILNIPSPAIHIENDISLLQKKLWFELVYSAFPKMGKQREYTITLKKLRELIGWSDNTSNDQKLKDALLGLNKSAISWNIFNKDNKRTWEAFPLLAGCIIPENSGMCTFAFSPFLEERFLTMGEEAYVKIDLVISNKFQSKHALSIYCLALDYLILKLGYSEKKFSLQELRKYLALKETEYPLTGNFNDRVIKPSEEEINEISDINIEIKPFKESRKIAGYKLCMSLKEGTLNKYTEIKERFELLRSTRLLEESQELQKISKKKKDFILINSEKLKDFFSKNSISISTETVQEKLKKLKAMFGEEKIEHYLTFLMNYTENEYRKGGVKSISGFFVSLIKDDSQIENYIFEMEKENQKLEAKKIKIEKMLAAKIEEKYELFLSEDFEIYLVDNIEKIEPVFIDIVSKNVKKGFAYDYLIINQNKGIIDKSLILKYKKHIRLVLINELRGFQNELGYKKPNFEDWKSKNIDENYLDNLRSELEKNS